ncbi:MAG: hypothetical protein IJ722_04195 [Alloprevotella sp.]|nr:hypothetical protein [Alloprevotella sp.]
MKERMNENAALPAEVRAAETGADAAPKAKKPYVKPTMQVFPLGCGLLAASGVSGPPVTVRLSVRAVDYYMTDWCMVSITRTGTLGLDFCGTTASGAWAAQAAELDGIIDGWMAESVNTIDCPNLHLDCHHPFNCGDFRRGLALPSKLAALAGPSVVSIDGADWEPSQFLANAVLQCDGKGGYSGVYQGQPFTATITELSPHYYID